MTDLQEKAMRMALEALDTLLAENNVANREYAAKSSQALRQALAQDSLRKLAEIDRELGLFDEPKQPEQDSETVMAKYEFQTYAAYKVDGEIKIGVVPEHTAWVTAGKHTVPLYTAPPKREWVGLTDEERVSFFTKSQNKFWDWDDGVDIEAFIRAIEAKLKEKNT